MAAPDPRRHREPYALRQRRPAALPTAPARPARGRPRLARTLPAARCLRAQPARTEAHLIRGSADRAGRRIDKPGAHQTIATRPGELPGAYPFLRENRCYRPATGRPPRICAWLRSVRKDAAGVGAPAHIVAHRNHPSRFTLYSRQFAANTAAPRCNAETDHAADCRTRSRMPVCASRQPAPGKRYGATRHHWHACRSRLPVGELSSSPMPYAEPERRRPSPCVTRQPA